jgi:hypothetical protein
MRRLCSVLTIAVMAACGGGTSTAGTAQSGQAAPQRSSNVVTAEEIQRNGGHDLQEILRMLRPAWFRSQPTRMTTGAVYADPIIVYIDGRRLGGLAQLRDIPVSGVISVRYYSASEAQGRFGLDHLQGAIDVATTR